MNIDTYKSRRSLFVVLAILLIVFVNVFVLNVFGYFSQNEDAVLPAPVVALPNVIDVEQRDIELGGAVQTIKPSRVGVVVDEPYFADAYPYDPSADDELLVDIPSFDSTQKAIKKAPHYALKNNSSKKARIAIIIDDVGMNRKQSRAVVDIDTVPLTLAFLPYAPDLKSLTEPAREAGHELMIHMPMEPLSSKVPLGGIAIKDDMNRDEIEGMLDKAYAAFDGYRGLNNHMGSRATQNPSVMKVVMDSLDKRGLFYVDSKTISTSIAANVAREQGIRHAERDIFIDHEESLVFAQNALQKLERVALQKGYAIGIGHPKKNTIAALKAWIPSLEARGFEIVPVSDLLMVPHASDVSPVVANVGEVKVSQPKPKVSVKAESEFQKPAPKFILNEPNVTVLDLPEVIEKDVPEIEPAAGEKAVQNIPTEDLLSAPIGASEDFSGGLYSLSE